MAVVTHMRLKHPQSRELALYSSKGDTLSSNSDSHQTSTLGDSSPTSRSDLKSTNGNPSYSVTPTFVAPKPKEAKISQSDPSRISDLYPHISITVGETLMEPVEHSDWSVELKGDSGEVKLPRIVKEKPSVELESSEVDLKLKLQSYQGISFNLIGSQQNGFEDLEPEVILHENNNEQSEQGPTSEKEATNTKHSKDEDRTARTSVTSDKIDENDPLANCKSDDDLDAKQRLKSYPNISFEVTLTHNKRQEMSPTPTKSRDRFKKAIKEEVVTYDDFVIDQEEQARRILTPISRLQTFRVKRKPIACL